MFFKPSTKEISALTGMRGIAACLVMLYHFSISDVLSGPAKNFIHHGYLWVDFFFVLSGYVLALTYGESFTGAYNLRTHLWMLGRRIGRVYPLYFVASLAGLALAQIVKPFGGQPSSVGVLINLLGIQAWGSGHHSLVDPGWSISTEWAAYILFPVFARLMLISSRYISLICVIVFLISLIIISIFPDQISKNGELIGPMLDITSPATILPVIRCLTEFCLGLAAFRFGHTTTSPATVRHENEILALTAIALLLLCIPNSDLIIIPVFVAIIIHLACFQTRIARILGSGLPFSLGVLSYSIYLLHTLPLQFRDILTTLFDHFNVPVQRPLKFAFYVTATLVLSLLSYHFIEYPGRRLFRNLLESRRTASATPKQSAQLSPSRSLPER